MVESFGGYTTNLPTAALLDDDVVLAFTHDGQPLTPEHGGPCRLVVPKLYFGRAPKWFGGPLMREIAQGSGSRTATTCTRPVEEERNSDPGRPP